ncbi:MAG: NAD+ synthase [Leptospirales bacterium]
MRKLRLGLAQMNPTVGDIPGNLAHIKDMIGHARSEHVDLVAFPELAVTGYPPEDLLLKPTFIERNHKALEELLPFAPDLLVMVGFVDRRDDIYNAAAVLYGGKILGIYRKQYLPNYGVFDENRYFQEGTESPVLEFKGVRIGINICEDIWYPKGPLYTQTLVGDAECIINLSASPFHAGKREVREGMLKTRAADNACYIAYVNMVGGQDELVFDGQSLVIGPEGEIESRGKAFQEDFLVTEIDLDHVFRVRLHDPRRRKDKLSQSSDKPLWNGDQLVNWTVQDTTPPPAVPPRARKALRKSPLITPMEKIEEIHEALVLGVRDYVRKNQFQDVLIGLSGGIDSALVSTIAVDALGAEQVHGLFMPSMYTSQESYEDVLKLSGNLHIPVETIPIGASFEHFLQILSPLFQDRGRDTTEENLQSRIRGILMMALSNKFHWLVLTTGNKSEMSVGYQTLYGDMAGGFAVLKDLPKTLVYDLADFLNGRRNGLIPDRIIDKAPTAELRPNQKDADSLPPYEILDPIMEAYVEDDQGFDEIVGNGFDPQVVSNVLRLIDQSEYKRRQSPPGIKLTMRAFGKDWRVPITNRFKDI